MGLKSILTTLGGIAVIGGSVAALSGSGGGSGSSNSDTETIKIPQAEYDFTGGGIQRTNAHLLHNKEVYGQGITVAVVDTGVDLDHPDLVGNLIAGTDTFDGDNNPDPTDGDSHGTHVAGTIAATGGDGGLVGMAPEAKTMPIRA